MLTTPFLLRLRSYRRFSRMYDTRVRFACPIYFSRDQSSSKLIIFLDSKLERSNSRVAKIDSRLDSRNFQRSRIESRVEFRNSRVTVNLPLSGTVSRYILIIDIYPGRSTHPKVVFREFLHPIELKFRNVDFEERRKPENLEKNLSEQSNEQTTNLTHLWPKPGSCRWEASAITIMPSLLT